MDEVQHRGESVNLYARARPSPSARRKMVPLIFATIGALKSPHAAEPFRSTTIPIEIYR